MILFIRLITIKPARYKKLQIRSNILILNNTKLLIITNPIMVIGFFGATDFTNHSNQLCSTYDLSRILTTFKYSKFIKESIR